MRVLHVIDVLTLGGAQALALRIHDGLLRRSVDGAICVVQGPERTHASWALATEPTYLRFSGDYRRLPEWRRCARRLEAVIRAAGPDVVHSYNWLADVTAAFACAGTGTPHVAHLVDRRDWLRSRAWKHRVRRWLSRRTYERAGTTFLAVCGAVADYAAANVPVARSRIEVVYNSIDAARFAGLAVERRHRAARGPVTLGMLSRLEEEKGHGPFLDVVAELVRRGVTLRLRIAGDGPLRGALERRAEEPRMGRCVEVIGPVRDASEFYRTTDVFVVPSRHSEGLPTTILEAMASGCAVVATDVGGAHETIRSGVDGLVVPLDDRRALVKALESLILDAPRRATIGAAASQRVAEEFDAERMVDRVLAVYERVMGRAPGRGAHAVASR